MYEQKRLLAVISGEETNNVNPSEIGLGEFDLQTIQIEINSVTKNRDKYIKYTPEDRYNIGN